MYRQSPSWNQRSRGIKLKNILQICLLLAVCFWLIYQVKHSHDKKEFEETDVKASLQRTSGDGLIKLGRKDIRPREEDSNSKDDTHDEEVKEDETTGEEIEENKHDEDQSEDKKVEEEEDEAGDRDVETEEHEQEKSDAEIGLIDGEEREDGEENETQETESGEEHGQKEKESIVDDTDHDVDDRSSHEAREELYKADDASSAVTHDSDTVTENENERVMNSIEQLGNNFEAKNENNGEETHESKDRKDLEVEGSDAAGDGHQSNVTASATEEDKLHDSENDSTSKNEGTEGSNDHFAGNSTTELSIENNDLPTDNLIETNPEIGPDQGNVTDGTSAEGAGFQNIDPLQANNSIISVDGAKLDSNSTGSAETTESAESHLEEFSDSSNNTTDSSASEDSKLEEEENTSESSPEKNNEFEGEKSDSSDGTEILETTSTDNPEEGREDAIDITDTSISMLEKEIRTDLETLPEIQTEGTNSEDVAAE